MIGDQNQSVGVIGLGRMGSRIVVNLCKSGCKVVAFDVDPERTEVAQAGGATIATDQSELLARCDVILTCLPDLSAYWTVIDQVAAFGRAGSCLIETSTFPLVDRLEARRRLAARDIEMLDCPLVGSAPMAERREVSVYASGDTALLARHLWVLEAFSNRVIVAGDFGNGTSLKLVANILLAIHNVAAAEAMVFGQKAGLDPRLIHRVISGSAASSGMFEVRGALMSSGNYHSGMSYAIALKDARIVRTVAEDLQCPLPLYAVATQNYQAAISQGWADYDTASVCAVLERHAGVVRGGASSDEGA